MVKILQGMLYTILNTRMKASAVVTKGEILVDKGSGATPYTIGDGATSVILGIANETLTADASPTTKAERIAYAYPAEDKVMIPFWTGGTKKVFAETDLGLLFEMKTSSTLDPDTQTDGFAELIDYDNDELYAVVILHSLKHRA